MAASGQKKVASGDENETRNMPDGSRKVQELANLAQ
jgi:hypothetical protein